MTARTTLALIGPGAIGATIACRLAQSPELAVTVCARTPFEQLVVETPGGRLEAAVPVLTDPADAQVADWVLIATKAYETEATARWLVGLLGPQTRVAVLQNGVEHVARFTPFVPAARILPVVVDISAERQGPGQVRQREGGGLTVPDSADGRDFAALFALTGLTAATDPDFISTLWRKLCLNAAGAVNGIAQQPARIAHDSEIAALMRGLAAECAAVGRAEGATLDDDMADQVVARFRGQPGDSVNSLLADRRAGGRTEYDARNGVVVRLGEKHGIPTPLNRLAAALLRVAE